MPPQPRKPADVSATNKERNEYIPSFISKKPFYIDSEDSAADYLEHQRLQKAEADSKWYDRGRKLGPAATKFRKGACENCGAMTHKTKECLSRPRKQGARWTGRDIQADEAVEDVQLGWDAKRDRWNGYDAAEYTNVVEEYNQLEDMKKKLKGGGGKDGKTIGDGDDADGEDEGDRYEAETDMGRHQAKSTRNLRLREDTAKYLLNLDLDSAKYDPKTRSMVDSGATADQAAALVAEEGFMRASGDAAEFERAQRYAWETQERGDKNKLHLQANPTSGEYTRKQENAEREAKREAHRKALLDKYGGQEHLQTGALNEVAVEASETYVEYDERGKIKGVPEKKAKSKYAEDVFINNHTSVWGSWWTNFKWGYACCHSTVKNSYCTGEGGKRAIEESKRVRTAIDMAGDGAEALDETVKEVPREIAWKEEELREEHVPNGVERDEKAKLHEIRKRRLEEMRGTVADDEMEEYRRKRTAADDPMRGLLGRDELVH